jgi:hypothetical protein
MCRDMQSKKSSIHSYVSRFLILRQVNQRLNTEKHPKRPDGIAWQRGRTKEFGFLPDPLQFFRKISALYHAS